MSHSDQRHADALDDLVAYLDGELAAERREHVERLVREDAELAGQADGLDRVWRLLDHLPDASPGETFVEHTMARVRQLDRRHGLRRRLMAWGGTLVSAAAAISPDATCCRKPGISTFTGHADTQAGFLQFKHRADSCMACSSV